MGTSDRIERERQAKRALILKAARELFVEKGYAAVTLRSVAERIEHSTTAVYVHFKDKRDLVNQMVTDDFAQFDAALLATAEVQPPLQRLVKLGEAYIEFALAWPKHYQLLFMTPRPEEAGPAEPPEFTPAGSDVGMSGFGLLLSTVQACMAEGTFHPAHRDPLTIAQAIWAGVHGLVSLLIIVGDVPVFQWREPKVLHQMLVGSMVRGMQLAPEGAEGAEGEAGAEGGAVFICGTAAGSEAVADPVADSDPDPDPVADSDPDPDPDPDPVADSDPDPDSDPDGELADATPHQRGRDVSTVSDAKIPPARKRAGKASATIAAATSTSASTPTPPTARSGAAGRGKRTGR